MSTKESFHDNDAKWVLSWCLPAVLRIPTFKERHEKSTIRGIMRNPNQSLMISKRSNEQIDYTQSMNVLLGKTEKYQNSVVSVSYRSLCTAHLLVENHPIASRTPTKGPVRKYCKEGCSHFVKSLKHAVACCSDARFCLNLGDTPEPIIINPMHWHCWGKLQTYISCPREGTHIHGHSREVSQWWPHF